MSEDTPLTLSVPEAGRKYFGLSLEAMLDRAGNNPSQAA
jgi:hypothetical protein